MLKFQLTYLPDPYTLTAGHNTGLDLHTYFESVALTLI